MLDVLVKNVTLIDGGKYDLGIQSGYFNTIIPSVSLHSSPKDHPLKAHQELPLSMLLAWYFLLQEKYLLLITQQFKKNGKKNFLKELN